VSSFKRVNGKLVKDCSGNHEIEIVVRMEGRAKMDWLQKTNLPLNDKWIGDLLQHKRNQNDLKSIVTISD
jgi:hypothetical protein